MKRAVSLKRYSEIKYLVMNLIYTPLGESLEGGTEFSMYGQDTFIYGKNIHPSLRGYIPVHSSHTELAMNLICISSEGGGGVTWEAASKGSLGDLATKLKSDVLLRSHSVKHTLDILLISYSYHLKLV